MLLNQTRTFAMKIWHPPPYDVTPGIEDWSEDYPQSFKECFGRADSFYAVKLVHENPDSPGLSGEKV